MPGFVDRVAVEAMQVRPVRVLLTVLALPFYALGVVVGVLWLAARFTFGAIKVGIADVQARLAAATPPPAVSPGEDVGD